jgi:3',5'-cyclic AMP phosphodiesterase CpdA
MTENFNSIIVPKLLKDYSADKDNTAIIITGDIVDDGLEGQLEEIEETVRELQDNFKVWAVPGNHEWRIAGNIELRSEIGYFNETFFNDKDVRFPFTPEPFNGHLFIGLNSMAGKAEFAATGILGKGQIEETREALEGFTRTGTNKIICFMHHHPFILPHFDGFFERHYEKAFHYMVDGPDFMNMVSGKIDVLLFGHDHHQVDYRNTKLCKEEYKIPVILSAGSSTKRSWEFKVIDHDGNAEKEKSVPKGMLGRLIEIKDSGEMEVETIRFDKS